MHNIEMNGKYQRTKTSFFGLEEHKKYPVNTKLRSLIHVNTEVSKG